MLTAAVIAPHIHSIPVEIDEPSLRYAHNNPTNESAGPGRMGTTDPMMPIRPHAMADMINNVSTII